MSKLTFYDYLITIPRVWFKGDLEAVNASAVKDMLKDERIEYFLPSTDEHGNFDGLIPVISREETDEEYLKRLMDKIPRNWDEDDKVAMRTYLFKK